MTIATLTPAGRVEVLDWFDASEATTAVLVGAQGFLVRDLVSEFRVRRDLPADAAEVRVWQANGVARLCSCPRGRQTCGHKTAVNAVLARW